MDLFSRREALAVSDLVNRLKKMVEDRFDFIWVKGEISGLRTPPSGHSYFNLKDDRASLRAVMFRQQAAMLRFNPEEGMEVLCSGRVSMYQPRGDLQLIVEAMEPKGAGALALAFEQLKNKLEAEGLFDAERKQPLPEMPQRVAVVTSPSGAAIRDFLKVLHRRFAGVQVAVYPVLVQGEQAAAQSARALEDLMEWGWPQVIVLTRGGGSPEDLASYNDEALARAIAACPIPVVSAVGHEVDVSIADLVADVRAPTPSAAAELLVKTSEELTGRLLTQWRRLRAAGNRLVVSRGRELTGLVRSMGDPRRRLAENRLRVDDLLGRAEHRLAAGLHRRRRALDALAQGLASVRPERRLALAAARCRELERALVRAQALAIQRRRYRLGELEAGLRALSPLSVLNRGYALMTDQAGALLRRADQALVGQRVFARLSEGRLIARVEEVDS